MMNPEDVIAQIKTLILPPEELPEKPMLERFAGFLTLIVSGLALVTALIVAIPEAHSKSKAAVDNYQLKQLEQGAAPGAGSKIEARVKEHQAKLQNDESYQEATEPLDSELALKITTWVSVALIAMLLLAFLIMAIASWLIQHWNKEKLRHADNCASIIFDVLTIPIPTTADCRETATKLILLYTFPKSIKKAKRMVQLVSVLIENRSHRLAY